MSFFENIQLLIQKASNHRENAKKAIVALLPSYDLNPSIQENVFAILHEMERVCYDEIITVEDDYKKLEEERLRRISKMEYVLENFDDLSEAQMLNIILPNRTIQEWEEEFKSGEMGTREEFRGDLVELLKDEKNDRPLNRFLNKKQEIDKKKLKIQNMKENIGLPLNLCAILELMAKEIAEITAIPQRMEYEEAMTSQE